MNAVVRMALDCTSTGVGNPLAMNILLLVQDGGGQPKRMPGIGSTRVGDSRVTPQSAVAVQTADDVVEIGGGDDDDEIIDLC